MRLSCSTTTFPTDRLEVAIAKVGWAGYAGVEVRLEAEPYPDRDELQRRLRSNDLELTAVHAGSLAAGEGDPPLDDLGRIGRAAAFASDLDCRLVILDPPRTGSLASLASSVSLLRGALGRMSIDLCFANRRGTLLAALDDLRSLHALDTHAGLALDPAHAALARWDPVDLDTLPELPRHVYLNDACLDRIVPPGQGSLALERLGRELRLQGFAGSVCLVLENADPWAVEPLARELREQAECWFDG